MMKIYYKGSRYFGTLDGISRHGFTIVGVTNGVGVTLRNFTDVNDVEIYYNVLLDAIVNDKDTYINEDVMVRRLNSIKARQKDDV